MHLVEKVPAQWKSKVKQRPDQTQTCRVRSADRTWHGGRAQIGMEAVSLHLEDVTVKRLKDFRL